MGSNASVDYSFFGGLNRPASHRIGDAAECEPAKGGTYAIWHLRYNCDLR